MARPKLKTLKSQLQGMPTSRIKVLETTAGATQRIRGREWETIRDRILRAHDGMCLMCRNEGIPRAADEVDHIVSLAAGGSNDDSNLQPLCTPHHAAKTAQEARERYRRA